MSNTQTDSNIRDIVLRFKKPISRLLIVTLLLLDFPVIPLMEEARAADVPANLWVTVPVKADPTMTGLTIPANAYQQGMWSDVKTWPVVAVHGALMPDGRVMSYGTDTTGQFNGRYTDIWDPSVGYGTNSHQLTYRAGQTDSFCSTGIFLNNGTFLISGSTTLGTTNVNKESTIYNPQANTMTAGASLASNRWYATMITLPDGRPLIMGGMTPYSEDMALNPNLSITQGLASMTPEVYENSAWRSLLGANSRIAFGPDYNRTSYPRAWVAPDGKVFGVSADQMWKLDATANGGSGAITYSANFKGTDAQGNSISYSATAPVNVGTTNTAVMYDIGKIAVLGGNGRAWYDNLPASDMVTAIDINGANPVLTDMARMPSPRRLGMATVLATGEVVLTGGTRTGSSDTSGNFSADIWNPTTNTWVTGASASVYRGYHSNATLMPNGTILAYGGGWTNGVRADYGLKAEVYYPPNLFKNQGGTSVLATRPVIKAISGLSYLNGADLQLDMTTANPISKLVLIGLSNSTHAFNAGQRRIPLIFTQESFRLTTVTPNVNITPPGYYQIVAIDSTGVPSLGTIISIGNVTPPTGSTTPYTPPVVSQAVAAPVINSGGTANFTFSATSGVTYSWNFGDGSPDTAFNANPAVSHSYAQAGLYIVTLTSKDGSGATSIRTFLQAVATTKTALKPNNSTPIMLETRNGSSTRSWVVNPDNDSVSVFDTVSKAIVATISVGQSPRTLAIAPDARVWVTNKDAATISVISPTTLAVVQTIPLPRASRPHGIAFAPNGSSAYVVLEASGQLLKLDPSSGAQQGVISLGNSPRHVAVSADSATVLVSRFITPPLPGEATANVDTSTAGGEVLVVNPASMTLTKTITLQHSDHPDTQIQGAGIPNYLGAATISPDGTNAWVPSKQDNIKRGVLRNGFPLNFQNTVRAISSNIDMTTLTESYAKRVDHDNSSLGAAAVYHPSGVYLFVALETSRQVAVVDAMNGGTELFKINVGRAPQGITISADGNTLYVQEFMDRSVSVIDLTPLTTQGLLNATVTNVINTVSAANEKLSPAVVLGKQLFYDAKDPRLSRDSYMSCASCHNDGGHDGRVWDLTGFGEGLRNTIALKGRAGTGHGFLHWSANFDEIQDFEKQIRDLAGGLGLMTDTQFNTGTRNQPLGDPKAGVSADLDLLATYVGSLNTFDKAPSRNTDGTLTASATLGKAVFQSNNCASCHAGARFTDSVDATTLKNIGTIKAVSGKRLDATLTGIDVPTLADVWATAPYLHDGSAPTLGAAIQAHTNVNITQSDINNLVSYIQQLGSEETPALLSPSILPDSYNIKRIETATHNILRNKIKK